MENKEQEAPNVSSENAGAVTDPIVKRVENTQSDSTLPKDSSNDVSTTHHIPPPKSTESISLPNSQSSGPAAQTSKPASYVPPVKRFNTVNINKKFLEKTSSVSQTSSPSHHTFSTSSAKQNGTIARPTPQSTPSHSRLVTTKLTAASSSSSTAAGWSRPNSVTPPVPSNAVSPTGPGASGASSSPSSASQASAGKVISPQVRPGFRQKSDGKPAWGSVAQNTHKDTVGGKDDFPTAAEAAQGLKTKTSAQKVNDATSAHEQALHDTADAFRGVHLDPNAHHWDEMDEDDNDDYLGEVIEFGDGRQYTIQVNDDNATTDAKQEDGEGEGSARRDERPATGSVPVSKEERFGDDFDRSWPRGREGRTGGGHRNDDAFRGPPSDAQSNSSRDANHSRVLFNERSNRMEPYDNANRGPSSSQFRRGPGEAWTSTGSRFERDPPPHGSRPQLHVLQKSQRHGDFEPGPGNRGSYGPRSRRDTDMETGSTFSWSSDGRRSRRYSNARSTVSNASSRDGRPYSREHSRTRDGVNGHFPTERRSSYTKPRESLRELNSGFPERQLPPHMMRSPRPVPAPLRPLDQPLKVLDQPIKTPSTEAQDQPPPSTTSTAHQPSPSSSAPPPGDVEALRKAFLHERAEEARRRRQLEEEERAKAQERARLKALELEAKLSVNTPSRPEGPPPSQAQPEQPQTSHRPTESQVLSVIEEAIRSAASVNSVQDSHKHDIPDSRNQRPDERTVPGPGRTTAPNQVRPSAPAQQRDTERVDSWRKPRATPAVVEPANAEIPKPNTSVPAVTLAHASSIDHVFDTQPGEDIEVVDFSELGKLANVSNMDQGQSQDRFGQRPRKHRDSFDDRREQQRDAVGSNLHHRNPPFAKDMLKVVSQGAEQSAVSTPLPSPSFSTHNALASPGRVLRQGSFREVPLSALDDTMSRIKGVLDGMHSSGAQAVAKAENKGEVSPQQDDVPPTPAPVPQAIPSQAPPKRWLPPALRPAVVPDLFDVTVLSLTSQDVNAVVRLPKQSRAVGLVPRKQYNDSRANPGPARWDILSFDPPVDGMNRRSFSLNDVLFGRPYMGPGRRPKYRVWLPRTRRTVRPPPQFDPSTSQNRTVGPQPPQISKSGSVGAFGRPSMADTTSWRSARKPSEDNIQPEPRAEASTLSVTSRSPPPEPVVQKEEPVKVPSTTAVEPVTVHRRVKAPVGMPEGADVAFSRNLNVGSSSVKVNFTVSSELDDSLEDTQEKLLDAPKMTSEPEQLKVEEDVVLSKEPEIAQPSSPVARAGLLSPERSVVSSTPKEPPLLLDGDAKVPPVTTPSKVISELRSVTPPLPASSSIWGKSPSRAPNKEHLKAVWSQTSDRDPIPTVNSLKEIADDLPAVPFSIHEAKLDDDGTPPPIAPPARMSASDVTRAFQTVPAGPSGSKVLSHPFSPPMSHMPSLSPPGPKPATIGMQPMTNSSRPLYMSYSAAQSHTPSPTLVYPQLPTHVMQTQIRPPSSPYVQPMWMPVQNHPVQHSPQLMRAQPASPYGAPVVPYQPAQGGLYPPPNGTHHATQGHHPMPYANGSQRMQLISPVLSAASPVHAPVPPQYSTSPMLVHVHPPGNAPPTQPYPGPVGMGRGHAPGQPPVDNRQLGHPMSHPAPPMPYSGHTSGYSHVPPQPFVRPSW